MIYLAARWAACLLVILQVVFWYMLDWRASQGFHVLLTCVLALIAEFFIRSGQAAELEMMEMTRQTEDVNQKMRDQLLGNVAQDSWEDEDKRKVEEFKSTACDPQG